MTGCGRPVDHPGECGGICCSPGTRRIRGRATESGDGDQAHCGDGDDPDEQGRCLAAVGPTSGGDNAVVTSTTSE